ncbi:MAG: family 78 glycoside hydrolase catalytic domain [Lachnospiraceae bacterium]|nr:family 78 glycoside hydrolase catalytic domain [Lachnospiraceae bacterium]
MKLPFITWEMAPFQVKGPIQPAVYVRKTFVTRPGLKRATLTMTSLGNYIPFINGVKPGNSLYTPGYTEYSVRLQYQTYDVTEWIREGKNALCVMVGDGWYRGSCGPMGMRGTYGDITALAGHLVLSYEDGAETIKTDNSWRWTDCGPVREQDMKLVEHYDAKAEATFGAYLTPDYDDTSWQTCVPCNYAGMLVPSEGEIVCAHEVFTPQVLHTPNGETVLDFGQNLAGYVSFTVTGKAGQTARLYHGEALDENGNFTTSNLGDDRILRAGQELIYELKDGTQSYTPYFMVCGFRYVKVVGWPETVLAENFTATAVYSDLRMTGTFTCSNEKINRLVKNVEWSLKSNFVDIPTDCPHRERAGWTGDINVFIETADLLADTRKFISKWMKDLLLTQRADGAPLSIVPKVYMMTRKSNETTPGAAGWADAVTQIPMRQYLTYGDQTILAESYEGMRRFIEYNVRRAAESKPLRNRFRKDGDNRYILDAGYHYGEWLEPGSSNLVNAIKPYLSPDDEVSTAWFYYSAKTLSDAATILGKDEDAKKYGQLAEKIKRAYNERFLKNGDLKQTRQCKYVRPLYMGLAEDKVKAKLAAKLNELVVGNGYKIGTGFLSTYQILNVLTDNGYNETAYRMLENESCPGWLYEVNRGATSIWEGWDAIDPATGKIRAKSQNHYSPGAALSWLWTRCCGIRALEPGYKKIEVAPHPGGSLTWAKATYDSSSGRISASWERGTDGFVLHVEIPEDVDATVILPDGRVFEHALSGKYA